MVERPAVKALEDNRQNLLVHGAVQPEPVCALQSLLSRIYREIYRDLGKNRGRAELLASCARAFAAAYRPAQ